MAASWVDRSFILAIFVVRKLTRQWEQTRFIAYNAVMFADLEISPVADVACFVCCGMNWITFKEAMEKFIYTNK